jgi:cyclic pyranopterin phosphate synthase
MSDTGFTHLDEQGRPRMVEVGEKEVTARTAVAEGHIRTSAETVRAIVAGQVPKGNVAVIAQLAGIMGSKRTAELIPLCHPLPLTSVNVDVTIDEMLPGVRVTATAKVDGKTGVEMEALTAVSCALLTVYDLCKARDRGMVIGEIRLVAKEGGRSGRWTAGAE